MVFPASMLAVLIVSLAVSAIGFKYYIWFFSIGYGLSIAALGVLLMAMFAKNLTLGTALCCLVLLIYGLRLGGYLAYREIKVRTYSENMKGEIKDSKTVPMFDPLPLARR